MRYRVITLIVAGLGLLAAAGFRGGLQAPGGGCPGELRTLGASTWIEVEKVAVAGTGTIDYTGTVKSNQSTNIRAGHVVANWIGVWALDPQGQWSMRGSNLDSETDMSCLHHGLILPLQTELNYSYSFFSEDPPAEPCWKYFGTHEARARNTMRVRKPRFGYYRQGGTC